MGRMPSGELADARTALHAQWDRLRSWVEDVVDDDVADDASVLEGWTVAQLVAHLGRAMEALAVCVPLPEGTVPLTLGEYVGSYAERATDIAETTRKLAVEIAHQTYRSPLELDERFGRIPQGGEEPLEGGRFAVQSYLDHHGDKLARRFDANTYVVLTRTMITHDLGRDRGGVTEALGSVTARALVIAVDSDRLFPPAQSERIAAGIRGAQLHTIHSDYGHDGFLIEEDLVGAYVREFLEQAG